MAAKGLPSGFCKSCAHVERQRLDFLVAAGAEIAPLARQFGLSRPGLARHAARHISASYTATIRIGPHASEEALRKLLAEEGSSIVQNLQALYAGYAGRWLANLEAGADHALVSMGREMREILTLRAKISKELAPPSHLSLHAHFADPRIDALRRALMDYAQAHPEARHDLGPVLRSALGTDAAPTPLNITPERAHAAA